MARRRKAKAEEQVERRQPALVLVAGDYDGTNELLCRVLTTNGFRAAVADSAERALAKAAEQLPRCVVIDLGSSTGIGSSMRLLDSLRQSDDPRIRSTRVVVVARSQATRNYCFQSGADGFLERPFHARELLATITEVLAIAPEDRAVHRREQLR